MKGKIHMQPHIIVPLDGSTDAEAILSHALFFAHQTRSTLLLLRVIMPPGEPEYVVPYIPDDWYEGEVNWTQNYLTDLAARLEAQGVRVQTQHVEGTFAGAAISSFAEQHADAQLIALATHGRGADGRLLLGSVAGDIFAHASTSLLLLHPSKSEKIASGVFSPASYQTIMVPLDGAAPGERVLERATALVLDCNASVLLVAVLPPYLLEQEVLVDEIVEPLQRAPAHEEMERADLSGADLRAIDLTGSNLARADLSGANLSGAILLNVDLSGADLTGANLSGMNATKATLAGATLSGANLAHADLSGANLVNATHLQADLVEANLADADMS